MYDLHQELLNALCATPDTLVGLLAAAGFVFLFNLHGIEAMVVLLCGAGPVG